MAGYLGTLFMANVGMRLLLPPQSEFNKAATNFGTMVNKIRGYQQKYFTQVGAQNISSLRRTLSKSAGLAEQYANKQTSGTLRQLNTQLSKIHSITQSKTKTIMGRITGANTAAQKFRGIMGRPLPTFDTRRGASPTFAKRYADDLRVLESRMRRAEISANAMTRAIADGADQFSRMGSYLLGTFRQGLAVSVTLLTTLGYTIKGISSDFAQFENQLINANSIWQESNEVLYSISDEVVKFGEDYGVAYENASRVLYQFASAGLDAAEAQAVLKDVLILTMAVQGDANTIGKLTVQTIKGFGLEMSDAGVVTDKFAHAINASLIEYQDLAAAIKFALPFYAATNQNLDQLLGSIQILTDRALEAGIAGRGLRQALAEFAEGAEDATRKFSEMGVKVVDAQGNFLQMTEIARNFANAIGTEIANDTELLTALIDDLNIRGATAFIHLVQNVDEFEEAVSELANSQGAANEMAMIQQASLSMQIQLLRNAAKEVFYLSDANYTALGYMNEFDMRLKSMVESFRQMFITDMPDGSKELTQFAYDIQDLVITSLEGFETLLNDLIKGMIKMSEEGYNLEKMGRMLFVPLQMVTSAFMMMDQVLGRFGSDGGLILKFVLLQRMFGGAAAAAITLSSALANLFNKLETIGDVVGILLILASIIPTGGGSLAVTGGARGAGMAAKMSPKMMKGMPGYRSVFKSDSGRYRAGLDKIDAKYPRSKAYETISKPAISQSEFQKQQLAAYRRMPGGGLRQQGEVHQRSLGNVFEFDAAAGKWMPQQTGFTMQGAGGIPTSYRGTLLPSVYNPGEMYRRTHGYTNVVQTQAGRARQRAILAHSNQWARERGARRMMYGGFGMYSGYEMAFGFGGGSQNFAYDPMMAQMSNSSLNTGGGGQDLYINNANISTSNFQDLFYNSDQLGG